MYNRNIKRQKLQVGKMNQYIEIYRRLESPNLEYGGQVKIKYKKIHSCLCEWNIKKEILFMDESDAIPTKYINNIKIRIPYTNIINTYDCFVKKIPDDIMYRIINITDEENNKKYLAIELQQWNKDEK